jgi:multidrug efflux system outer membrane protein
MPGAVVPAHLHLDLLAHLPDVRAALALAEASQAQTRAAQAAFYPNISFSALLNLDSAHLASLFAPGSIAWQFGPALHLPLFESGALHAKLHGAEAQQRLAVALYQETLLDAARQALQALNDLEKSQQTLRHSLAAWKSGNASLALESTRERLGLEARSQFLAAESRQLQRSVEKTLAENAVWQAWAAWQSALGGGYGR